MKRGILVLMAIVLVQLSFSQAAKRQKIFNLENGNLAINGYDPVSYFTQKAPQKGTSSKAANLEGISYYFSSDKNKQLFLANPKMYEPQYGGWCAFAMGKTGEKVEVDPETYKIVDGKLYLFYNKYFTNTLKSWNKDEPNLKRKADESWVTYLK